MQSQDPCGAQELGGWQEVLSLEARPGHSTFFLQTLYREPWFHSDGSLAHSRVGRRPRGPGKLEARAQRNGLYFYTSIKAPLVPQFIQGRDGNDNKHLLSTFCARQLLLHCQWGTRHQHWVTDEAVGIGAGKARSPGHLKAWQDDHWWYLHRVMSSVNFVVHGDKRWWPFH